MMINGCRPQIHLLVSPWLLRTIHRKASQADAYYGYVRVEQRSALPRSKIFTSFSRVYASAEFMSEINKSKDRTSEDEEDAADSDADETSQRAAVAPAFAATATNPARKAFFNVDGTATIVDSRAAALGLKPPSSSARNKEQQSHGNGAPPSPPRVAPSASFRRELPPEALLTASSSTTDPDQIPFASPVFVLDRSQKFPPPEFWRRWHELETT